MKLKRGLTIGKFAPLHQGHQLLLETALAEMDELIMMIYNCPKITDIPQHDWFAQLYA
jgi:HTH-type transcriptional repressor of NAD biosynthesis genes